MRIFLIAFAAFSILFTGACRHRIDNILNERTKVVNNNIRNEKTKVAVNTPKELDGEKIETVRYSSDCGRMTVYPEVTGPADRFQPIYKVMKQEKVSGSGSGLTEELAVKAAVYDACAKNRCDLLVAMKTDTIMKTTKKSGIVTAVEYTVTVKGFPVELSGVRQIEPTYYIRKIYNGISVLEKTDKLIFPHVTTIECGGLPLDALKYGLSKEILMRFMTPKMATPPPSASVAPALPAPSAVPAPSASAVREAAPAPKTVKEHFQEKAGKISKIFQ